MRLPAVLVALALPLQAMAAAYPDHDAFVITVCTAEGPRELTVDANGRPVAPSRRNMPACAHLWCEGRRPRPDGKAGA